MSQYLSQPRGYASESETGSMYELRQYPSYYSSQASITPYGSHKSLLSMYTPSQASTFLPIVQNAPNPEKRPADNFGIAMFSVFINPIFGIIAIFLSQMSKDYFNRCKYIKASKYGAYAKGTAMGGIISMIIVLFLIAAQLIHYHMKFYYQRAFARYMYISQFLHVVHIYNYSQNLNTQSRQLKYVYLEDSEKYMNVIYMQHIYIYILW